MVRKRSESSSEEPLLLTMNRDDAHARIADRIQKGEGLLNIRIANEIQLKAAQQDYYTWDEYNKEMLRRMFTTTEIADQYSSSGGFVVGSEYSFANEVQDYVDDVKKYLRRLKSIQERLELIPIAPSLASPVGHPANQKVGNKAVFIVHGHDDSLLQAVARFLSNLDLEPIILHEQPNKGRTIVEKLEAHSQVNFAVVLLTPDDVGGSDDKHLLPRARQNVVLELGFFLASLGRANVAALHKGEQELPSDYMGVVYIPVDTAGAWKFGLAKELRASGLPVDMNKL